MKITKVSIATNKKSTRDLDVTFEQLSQWINGAMIQDAMPHLSADEREFLLTGISKDEWDELFPPEDDA